MLDIRVANLTHATDAKALLDLLGRYALNPMGGGQPLSEFTQSNLVDTLRKRQDCMVILTYDENRAVGLCICFEGFSTFACKPLLNIHDVYVEENYRGQGIAGDMLHKAEQLAREKGYCKATLEVLGHNHSAKRSYRAAGFQPYQLDDRFGQAEFWQKLFTDNN